MMQIMVQSKALIKKYFKRLVAINGEFIRAEACEVKTLMRLIIMRLNTGNKWTQGELKEFRMHSKNALKIIYALVILLLPGGLLLLPLIAVLLNRSKV
jgi:hypothetical protein